MLLAFRRLWCRTFHRSIMLLGGREYECRRCGLRYDSLICNSEGKEETRQCTNDTSAPLSRHS
jgi:hypothetical protein